MSQSRKKFKSRSTQSSKNSNLSNKKNSDSNDVIKKLDNLRSSAKQEQKKITTDSSKNNQIIAIIVIIVVGMSGIVVLSQLSGNGGFFGLTTSPQSNKDIVSTPYGGFKQDKLISAGTPGSQVTFVYVGGEFCPYCAMERWAIVMALEHFGNFSGIQYYFSSEDNIPTIDFTKISYTSNIVDFQHVEVYDNKQNNFQTLNDYQNTLYTKYGTGSIPFICIGGKYFQSGAGGSLNLNSFSNIDGNQVQQQIDSGSGNLYQQVSTESSYMVSIINNLLTSQNSSTTSTTTTSSSTGA